MKDHDENKIVYFVFFTHTCTYCIAQCINLQITSVMLQKCQTSSQDDTVELCGNLLSFYLNGKSHFLL